MCAVWPLPIFPTSLLELRSKHCARRWVTAMAKIQSLSLIAPIIMAETDIDTVCVVGKPMRTMGSFPKQMNF